MDPYVVECEAERETAACASETAAGAGAEAGAGLAVLADVRRQYEQLLQLVERRGGRDKLQKQVDLLRSWVSDLLAQNTLLVRAVEDLETEATTRLMVERRRHLEMLCELRAENAALRSRMRKKDSDVRGLLEVLRRIREFDYFTVDGIHFYEITESDLFGPDCRGDIESTSPGECSSKIAEYAQSPDLEPVKDSDTLREEQPHEKLREMENYNKSQLHSVRCVNVALYEQLLHLGHEFFALEQKYLALTTRAKFKDDIIKEMQRQLKQMKEKTVPGASETKCLRNHGADASSLEDKGLQTLVLSAMEHSTSTPLLVCERGSSPLRDLKACQRLRGAKSRSRQLSPENSSERNIDIKPISIKIEKEQESLGASSVAGSGAGSVAGSGQCSAVTRALHYHDKLMATLQVLENKDEMIRVQTDSIRLAESRISELTSRAEELRQKLLEKSNELQLVKAKEQTKYTSVETQDQEGVVRTLESNLLMIEELYRECFYEAARQEKLIDMLRSDILDVRQMDRQKDTQIQRLQDVVSSQKWSLEQCQDIAMEVDTLKMEISNFLSSSNNDSGMWERDSSPSQGDATEDLREITSQLLQLREILTADCTCGLENENKRLIQENEAMQIQITELERRLSERENELSEQETARRRLETDIEMRDKELSEVRQKLDIQETSCKEQGASCKEITRQLKQAEELLSDKCADLAAVQRLYAQEQSIVRELKMELQKRADDINNENSTIRSEVSTLRGEVSMWRSQLADSERAAQTLRDQLQSARRLLGQVDCCYQQKVRSASELQLKLDEAQRRGEALCAHARDVILAVRDWTRKTRDMRSNQEQQIKTLQETIGSLQRLLNEKTNGKSAVFESSSSKMIPRPRSQRSFETSAVRTVKSSHYCGIGPRDSATKASSSSKGSNVCKGSKESATETASSSSAPVPLKRMSRKKSSEDRLCLCQSQRERRWRCECDVRGVDVIYSPFPHRDLSPTSALEARVSHLNEALSQQQRRWSRARSVDHR